MAYGDGFVPSSVEHFVILEWDISRSYEALVLPINYQEYHDLLIVPRRGNNEFDYIFPTSVLAQGITDYGSGGNNRISFDPATRTMSRVGSGQARINGFVYAELRR